MKYFVLLFFLSFSFQPSNKIQKIDFEVKFGEQRIQKDHWYLLDDDSLQITELKFYLSDLRGFTKNKKELSAINKYLLFKLGQTISFELDNPSGLELDSLHFQLGIDSLAHETEEYQGALDPVHGMYWTWHSGFVHFKLEGRIIKEGKENKINLHLGGYQGTNKTNQFIGLKISDSKFVLDLGPYLKAQNELNEWSIMSVSPEAKKSSDLISKCFQ